MATEPSIVADWPHDYVLSRLRSEPCAVVRRALAREAAMAIWTGVRYSLQSLDSLPEAAYVLEAVGPERIPSVESGVAGSLPQDNAVGLQLALLYWLYIVGGRWHPATVAVQVALEGGLSTARQWADLDVAFRSGRATESSAASAIPESVVRQALDLVSPFDSPGLGINDELAAIGRIDEAYLALRQLLYSIERGLIGQL